MPARLIDPQSVDQLVSRDVLVISRPSEAFMEFEEFTNEIRRIGARDQARYREAVERARCLNKFSGTFVMESPGLGLGHAKEITHLKDVIWYLCDRILHSGLNVQHRNGRSVHGWTMGPEALHCSQRFRYAVNS